MTFSVNSAQLAELQGLAMRVADLNYELERHGESCPEIVKCRDNVSYCLDACDRAGVPFWVQNIVLVWASNWRSYAEEYTETALQRRGVSVNV